MRLSTKGRYAVTAMLELALNEGNGPLPLADISANQNISLSYLEQLFAHMRAKGLVRGVRGPGGGYFLDKSADDISIADVICAVDEWVEMTRFSEHKKVYSREPGITHLLWNELSQEIIEFLGNITLGDLVRRVGDSVPHPVENAFGLGSHRAA